MEILVIILLLIIGGLLWYIKHRNDQEAALIAQKVETSLDLKRTMAMGLASRFNFPRKQGEEDEVTFEQATDIFLKQTPLEFEDFVSGIMEKRFGGKTYTTASVGDFGVDFEHETEDGLFLGMVKATKDDIDATPIALIHSNMVKQKAKGGYVITTSDFTQSAKDYARGLNIKLINGVDLVTYWLEAMHLKVYKPKSELA